MKLKGFDEPRQLCRASPRSVTEAAALEARGPAASSGRASPLLVLLSGGGDSVCLLDVARRLGARCRRCT